jgi:large-conductance mechanosensitive channel
MRGWATALVQGRAFEIAVAVALGYAAVGVVEQLAALLMGVLAQHVGSDPFASETVIDLVSLFQAPYYLNFSVAGTIVVYGNVLSATLALVLVALAGAYVVRRRDRELGACPFCASRIPYESTHCAYCGSGTAPGEP